MLVSIEISYYPLADNFNEAIDEFLNQLMIDRFEHKIGPMSTIITGDIDDIFQFLSAVFKILMEKYPSVFNLKVSNACPL